MLRDASHDLHEAARRTIERRFPECPIAFSKLWDARVRTGDPKAKAELHEKGKLPIVLREDRPRAFDVALAWWREHRSALAWEAEAEAFLIPREEKEREANADLPPELDAFFALTLFVASLVEAGTTGGGGGGGWKGNPYSGAFSWRVGMETIAKALDSPTPDWVQSTWTNLSAGLSEADARSLALLALRDSDASVHVLGREVLRVVYGVSLDTVTSRAMEARANEYGIKVREFEILSPILPSDRERAFFAALAQLE